MTGKFISHCKIVSAWRFLFLLVCLMTGHWSLLWGQHIFGGKSIKVYESSMYPGGNKNWWIEEDHRGFIYVANEKGLIEYDGEQWRCLPTGNSPLVRSIAFHPHQNTLFIGKTGDFGYIELNSSGELYYQSIPEIVTMASPSFSDVWNVRIIDQDVFFLTYRKLFRFNVSSRQLKKWSTPTQFTFSGVVNNQLYIGQKDLGLFVMENDSLVLKNDHPDVKKQLLYNIVPFRNNKLLITSPKELIILNRHSFKICDSTHYYRKRLMPVLKGNIYYITPIANNQLAIVTNYNGIYLLDQNLEISGHYSKRSGLPSNLCRHIKQCRMGALWIASDNGLVRIYKHDCFGEYNTAPLNGVLQDLIRYDNRIYIGTNEGVFHKPIGRCKETTVLPTVIQSSCSKFMRFHTPSQADSILLAATNEGLWSLSGAEKTKLIYNIPMKYILQSKLYPERLYFFNNLGIGVIKYRNGTWSKPQLLLEKDRVDQALYEDDHGSLWECSYQKGVFKLQFQAHSLVLEKIEHFPINDQQKSPLIKNSFFHNNRLYICQPNGILSFNHGTQSFKVDTSFNRFIPDGAIPYMLIGEKDNIWLAAQKDELHELIKISEKRNILENQTARLFQFRNRMITQALVDIPDQLYLGLDNRLAYVNNLNASFPNRVRNSVFIRKVKTPGDSTWYNGHLPLQQNPNISSHSIIPYQNRNIQFQFASPFFCDEKNNRYACILEGYDKDWSPWSQTNLKEYTNLKEGSYTFKVIALNTFNQKSDIASYSFRIAPPYYRTWWAYCLYVLILASWIIISRRRTRYKYEQEKGVLEKKVQRRTRAILMQKEQLQKQARELQEAMHAQERLAVIASKIDNPVVICALTGRITWANSSFNHLFALQDQGENPILWSMPGNSDVEECFWKALFDRRPHTHQIKHTRTKNNTNVLYQVTMSPVLSAEGKVRQIIGVYADISNLYQLNKIRDMVMSVITHDLKSPLLVGCPINCYKNMHYISLLLSLNSLIFFELCNKFCCRIFSYIADC